jgi:hypothetical protein
MLVTVINNPGKEASRNQNDKLLSLQCYPLARPYLTHCLFDSFVL